MTDQTNFQRMLIIAAYAIESEYPDPTPAQTVADYTRNDIARTIARAFRRAGGEPIEAIAVDVPADLDLQAVKAADAAVSHPLVQEVVDELLGNLGMRGNSLALFGITKVASYAAQVAFTQANDIDPDALRRWPETPVCDSCGKPIWRGAPMLTVPTLPDAEPRRYHAFCYDQEASR